MAEEGSRRAALVLEMAGDYDGLLSTILVGNNIVNIAMASIATLWFTSVMKQGGASASTAFTTVAVLIFGEISPKSLAKEAPEKTAMLLAPLLRVCVTLLAPINYLFSLWKRGLSRVIKVSDERKVGGEELLAIVTEAEREGGIDDQESLLIKRAIEFGEHQAMDIATPRVDVAAISENASREEVEKVFASSGYSRLPVYRGSIDNITGVLHQKDLFTCGEDWPSAVKPPVFVTETIDIGRLLKRFQRDKCHMAVIADEFGGTAGIVTMEDILEELVGDIWDEHDEVSSDFVQEGDTLVIAGGAPVDDMMKRLGIRADEDFQSASVSGWVMEMIDRVPAGGDSFHYGGYDFTVAEAQGRRVGRLRARRADEGGE